MGPQLFCCEHVSLPRVLWILLDMHSMLYPLNYHYIWNINLLGSARKLQIRSFGFYSKTYDQTDTDNSKHKIYLLQWLSETTSLISPENLRWVKKRGSKSHVTYTECAKGNGCSLLDTLCMLFKYYRWGLTVFLLGSIRNTCPNNCKMNAQWGLFHELHTSTHGKSLVSPLWPNLGSKVHF